MPVAQGLCPECQLPLSCGDVAAQTKLRCPNCKCVFTAATLTDPSTESKKKPPAAPPANGTARAKPAPKPPAAPASTLGKSPPPASPAAGATIGRYEIREELGRGAFGTVYRAFDPFATDVPWRT